jgi:demethylspheroidene O-methyltransferase
VALPSFFLRFRNRLLADPKFLTFAQRFPLTRPVARSKSRELFNLLAGFSYSQVLYACVSLRVLEHVGQAGISPSQLALKIGITETKTDVLVRAAVALDILGWAKGQLVLGPHGAALLGQPWIMRFVDHHKYFYRDLEDPVALLKGQSVPNGLRSYWTYEDGESDKQAYSELMAASQEAVSQQILGAYNFKKHKNILDVGGGSGAFLRAVGRENPHLALHLFDLQGVISLVDENSKPPKLFLHSGDFRRDPLPQGMDLISLVRVVHDHDDDVILATLRNIRAVCSTDTTLLIAEPFAGNAANAAVTDAYFNFYFTAMGQGRTRSPKDIAELAVKAGFGRPKNWATNLPLITGLMTLRII